ncbi:hypothetical protein [Nostoc sp. FACHB-110]|nr:hypothetical protein [Nostoc sp. FACHB-110]
MSGEVVYTPDGEAVAVAEMMRRFPMIEDGRLRENPGVDFLIKC